MRFYIGSGFKNCELVNHYADLLTARGWTRTYDWTAHAGGGFSLEDLADFARRERRAIGEADVAVILLPAGRGTHVELGMALALGKKVFLCGGGEEFSLENTVNFYQLPEVVRLTGTVGENVEEIVKG